MIDYLGLRSRSQNTYMSLSLEENYGLISSNVILLTQNGSSYLTDHNHNEIES